MELDCFVVELVEFLSLQRCNLVSISNSALSNDGKSTHEMEVYDIVFVAWTRYHDDRMVEDTSLLHFSHVLCRLRAPTSPPWRVTTRKKASGNHFETSSSISINFTTVVPAICIQHRCWIYEGFEHSIKYSSNAELITGTCLERKEERWIVQNQWLAFCKILSLTSAGG
jgi:hypothetical protein